MQTEYTITCPIPGLEMVKVTYNIMATSRQIDQFQRSLGSEGADQVVVKVEGLPEKYTGPSDSDLPIMFRVWYSGKGPIKAALEYAQDPNS